MMEGHIFSHIHSSILRAHTCLIDEMEGVRGMRKRVRKRQKKKSKKKKNTALEIPEWSPTSVLIEPEPA
jgi:hypothetical protein